MRLLLLAWFSTAIGLAQLPPSSALNEVDRRGFDAEIRRIQGQLGSAADPATVTYQMARTFAFGEQWPECVEWLRKAVAFGVGFDPSRDSAFKAIQSTREFATIIEPATKATPPVQRSRVAFQIAEGDLVPESMAFDPPTKRSYFGSQTKGKVIACSNTGQCSDFAGGLGVVLGMKINGTALWLVSNSSSNTALVHYDLLTGREVERYSPAQSGHMFNDLVITPGGDIYLSDTKAGAVWRLASGGRELILVSARTPFANGIAMSRDAQLLYVSTFPDGITIVDLKTQTASPMPRPAGISLAFIDGLYCVDDSLLAIQNGFMTPRVVRLRLGKGGRSIDRMEVLERRNPLFDGITTGVVAGRDLFYMANIQDEKKTDFRPIAVLKLHL